MYKLHLHNRHNPTEILFWSSSAESKLKLCLKTSYIETRLKHIWIVSSAETKMKLHNWKLEWNYQNWNPTETYLEVSSAEIKLKLWILKLNWNLIYWNPTETYLECLQSWNKTETTFLETQLKLSTLKPDWNRFELFPKLKLNWNVESLCLCFRKQPGNLVVNISFRFPVAETFIGFLFTDTRLKPVLTKFQQGFNFAETAIFVLWQ